MNMNTVIGILLAAGIAGSSGANETPTRLEPAVGKLNHVAHIYFNVATGEKITTVLGEQDLQLPTDGQADDEVWVQDVGAQCADYGDSTEYFYILDDPLDTPSLHEMLFDWGDIEMDTVVDCVQIHWVTNHADTDTDGDQQADGVEGFAAEWVYWDGMNGRSPEFDCAGAPLIGLRFHNLAGELSDPNDDSVALYTADIDLGDILGGESSLVFEICDTDSDLQGAAVHNGEIGVQLYGGNPTVTQGDLDADGYGDWGWSVVFDQPGTVDVDNADGDNDRTTGVDGDPLALASAGVAFGAPNPGHPEFDSVTSEWTWVSDGPTAGRTEDLFNTAHLDYSSIVMDGPWWFGGLDCTPDEVGYVPAAMFQTVLYGPGDVVIDCLTDLNSDGEVDFFDVSFFLEHRVDFNGDTVFDFFDISLYLSEFSLGCP